MQAIREAVACVGSVTAPDFAERFIGTAISEYKGLDIIVKAEPRMTWYCSDLILPCHARARHQARHHFVAKSE